LNLKMNSRGTAPVFVVGTARSGTSLLYHMLLSSGSFPLYRTEPLVFDVLVPKFGDLRLPSNRRKLLTCWLRSEQFRRSGLDRAIVQEKVMSLAQSGGDFLQIVMGEMAVAGGLPRWAVWGPDNLLHIPAIKRQIPNALFVHVIRDGRDVACALERRGFIRPLPWCADDRLLVSGLHWMWKTAKGRHYGRRLGEYYLEIRFEELLLRPEASLAHISAFITQDLDYERIRQAGIGTLRIPNTSFPEELQSGTFSPVGRFARICSKQRLRQLEQAIGELLTELGYPLFCEPCASPSVRLDLTRELYFRYCDTKEWLKASTPLGRLVDLSGLNLDHGSDLAESGHLEPLALGVERLRNVK
jgi:hypothetical protein